MYEEDNYLRWLYVKSGHQQESVQSTPNISNLKGSFKCQCTCLLSGKLSESAKPVTVTLENFYCAHEMDE